jgi:tetratricopeptide (TPR) repeat protein
LEATLALDLAVWAYRQGLLEESEQEALRAREIAATAGDQAIEAKVVDMLARIAVLRGDIDRALELSVLAVDLHRKLGDEAGALRALYTQGEIAMDRGQAARARELHELVVRGSRASDDTRLENAALLSLAVLDAADGRFDEADERFEHCIELTRKSGARNAESLALAYRAICHERAGRIEDARSDLIEAIELSRASGNRLVEGLALAWKGRLAADADEIDESEACLAAAGALLDAIGDDVRGMVVDLCRGHLELARARALDATDPGRAEMLRDAVGEQLARVSEGGQNVAWDVRAAAERLACAAEARGPLAPPSTEEPIVRVAVDGKWFWDSAGHPTDLTRHGALCRVLEALARQHRDAPGTPLSVDDVFSAGWPGQRAHPRSAASRVYTAISTLRRMGLKEVLIRHHDGYVLKRSAHIETVAKAE